MRQCSRKSFISLLERNGFHFKRQSGGHSVYYNDIGKHISIPSKLKGIIALRLIKENNLK
jgi:predicted RNA binding protein YcfA (HicA-like mRNA interferase family)